MELPPLGCATMRILSASHGGAAEPWLLRPLFFPWPPVFQQVLIEFLNFPMVRLFSLMWPIRGMVYSSMARRQYLAVERRMLDLAYSSNRGRSHSATACFPERVMHTFRYSAISMDSLAFTSAWVLPRSFLMIRFPL